MKASPSNNYAYNKHLQPNANKLRHRMTKAEAVLWKYVLRARMMKGYGFRRQRPVLNYIADFMCKELNLIIEVDGMSHSMPGAPERDRIRQDRLEQAGFTVVRVTNDDVLVNMNLAIKKIRDVITKIEESKVAMNDKEN